MRNKLVSLPDSDKKHFCFFFLGASIIMNSRCWKLQESSRSFLSCVKCKPCISHLCTFLSCFVVVFPSLCSFIQMYLETGRHNRCQEISIQCLPVAWFGVISERNLSNWVFSLCSSDANHISIAGRWRLLTVPQTAGLLCGCSGNPASEHFRDGPVMPCNFLDYPTNQAVISLSAHSCQLFDFLLH